MPTFNPTNLELFTFYEQMKNDFENYHKKNNDLTEKTMFLKTQQENLVKEKKQKKNIDISVYTTKINNLKKEIANTELNIVNLKQQLAQLHYQPMDVVIKNSGCLGYNNEIIEKPGVFIENVIREICQHKQLNFKKQSINIQDNLQTVWNQKTFQVDGFIFNNPKYPDLYLESKCQSFSEKKHPGGTAHEKLPGFLDKARLYDKPVLLILSGILEVWGQSFSSSVLLSLSQNTSIPPLTTAEQQEINDSFIGQATRQLMQKTTPEGTPWLQITTLSNFINF